MVKMSHWGTRAGSVFSSRRAFRAVGLSWWIELVGTSGEEEEVEVEEVGEGDDDGGCMLVASSVRGGVTLLSRRQD